jgi:hypothetical protein
MREVAADLTKIPTSRCVPRLRAPVLYSERSLSEMLRKIAASVECAVTVSDLDRIFTLVLTSWVPSFLKDGEGAVAWAKAQGLDAEELMIAAEVTDEILAVCSDGSRELLRLKLDGRSDREIARRLGLSRPTVAKRKRALMLELGRSLDGLHDCLRHVVLDRLSAELSSAGRERHGSH